MSLELPPLRMPALVYHTVRLKRLAPLHRDSISEKLEAMDASVKTWLKMRVS